MTRVILYGFPFGNSHKMKTVNYMKKDTLEALETMQQVLNGAIAKGVFVDSTSVVVAHNALFHIREQLENLSGMVAMHQKPS